MKRYLFILILFFLLKEISAAQNSPVHVPLVDNAPKLDGNLDDIGWQKAAKITTFKQREPREGEPISEKTAVYICRTATALYFGFRCSEQDPAKITAKELARDVSLGHDDRVQIILDTFKNQKSAYWFQIGPRGSIGDALVSENGATFNKDWDGLWDGRAKIHETGWDAEVEIPFNTLSFNASLDRWGLKLIRHIRRKNEQGYWPVANLNTYKFQVSDAGTISGMAAVSQGLGLDIRPYGLGGMDRSPAQSNDWIRDAGIDVFYQVTSNLKSAITINTDFAQTEVDNRQINLTRFPLHYPEKRDFFLDGANYFNFGISAERDNPYSKRLIPFFSRRIGLDINGNPLPIQGGAKLTGQSGRYHIGLLHISDERTENRRQFSVARVSRDLGRQSSVGMIWTRGNATGPDENTLFGMDFKLATSSFKGNKNLSLLMFGLHSITENILSENNAFGCEIVYPNDMSFRLGFHQIDEHFVSGLGFVPRRGIRETYFTYSLGPRLQSHPYGLLQILFETNMNYITDMDNQLLTRILEFTPLKLRFLSDDQLSFNMSAEYERLIKDFNILKDEYIIPQNIYTFNNYWFDLTSAQHRNIWASTIYRWGDFYNGQRRDWNIALGYKIAVPFFLGLEWEQSDLEFPGNDYTVQVYRLNGNVLFSPRITLDNFIQYDNISENIGWQSRFRWILKPGNEIFLVWNSIFSDPLERFVTENSSSRLKFVYNYRF
ncbi:hypothetical protein GF406_04175 [candidate division KSB1 bacterium]|nr:hypothetical protein [candidate division KSB1 bacterium]